VAPSVTVSLPYSVKEITASVGPGRLFLSVVENGDTDGDNADDDQAKGKKPFVSNHSSSHSTAPLSA